MTKYKVGDVAALFSKPKSPTTSGGKKLQSLFEDYYCKKNKSSFNFQGEDSEIDKNEETAEVIDHSVSKEKRKRKFSAFNDSRELSENATSKKFKESSEQETSKNVESKKQKKLKKQKDFPRKNKQNSFNFSCTFPKFDMENNSEDDMQSPSAIKLSNKPTDNKQIKGFIKKSKKKSLDNSSNELSNKDFSGSDDESLKKEIKEFMINNSSEMEVGDNSDVVKKEKTSNSKKQDERLKPKKKSHQKYEELPEQDCKIKKKKYLTNDNSSPKKYKDFSEQNISLKKKNKKNRQDQQDFHSTKKESKANILEFGNVKSQIKNNTDNEIVPSENLNFMEQNVVKKSKKSKHGLKITNDNDVLMPENDSETYAPRVKEVLNFIRKPKNKKHDIFSEDNLKTSNADAFVNVGKTFKNREFNANKKMQNMKDSENVALDFIKLPRLNDDNERNPEDRLKRTLFIGNLPKNISKQELKNLFCAFGAIETVRIPGVETDKSKIFGKNPPKLLHSNYASDTIPGFVVFKEKEFAVEALKLSGSMFKHHHITVDFAVPAGTHKLYDEKRSIFIGNLPFNVKDESIWTAFNHCGRIEGVRVVRDRETGLGKGFGYVLFSTVEAKQTALALGTLQIEGREVRIKSCDSDKKEQKSNSFPARKDTFKSRAIRMKKNSKATGGHKSIRKLTKNQRNLHKKKQIAAVLQKAMK